MVSGLIDVFFFRLNLIRNMGSSWKATDMKLYVQFGYFLSLRGKRNHRFLLFGYWLLNILSSFPIDDSNSARGDTRWSLCLYYAYFFWDALPI